MSDKTWKAAERRVAGIFGTSRAPLSGGNGRQTRSDSLHERLFLETKYRKKLALVDLFIETAALAARERKLPVLALVEKRRKLVFAVVPLKKAYLYRLLDEMVEDEPASHGPAALVVGSKRPVKATVGISNAQSLIEWAKNNPGEFYKLWATAGTETPTQELTSALAEMAKSNPSEFCALLGASLDADSQQGD